MPSDDRNQTEVDRRIDVICDRFESEWRTEQRPRLEDYIQLLELTGPHLELAFQRLLELEIELRQSAGEAIELAQYLSRFPRFESVIVRQLPAPEATRERTATILATRITTAGERHSRTATGETVEITGNSIGRYRILKEIGRGTYGVVYQAHDPNLNRYVAIKQLIIERVLQTLSPEDRDATRLAGLLREARMVAGLDHLPGIVTTYDVISDETAHGEILELFIIQQYIEGGDLKHLLKAEQLTHVRAAQIMQEIASSMARIHQLKVWHRDLKPANILIDQQQHPYIADFGLAIDESLQKKLQGEVSGTLLYMPPEQINGETHRIDQRSDIWSLGVILFEMLTGERPFQGKSWEDLRHAVGTQEPRNPRSIRAEIPLELERICLRCLEKRQSERYQSAADLSTDLAQFLQDSSRDSSAGVSLNRPVPVRPRGLRAFDQGDSDFYLELLPGPRNRDGIPECVNSWTERIESIDEGVTFPLGVIYGPSGSGKSSLVRAGILPRLHLIRTIYVESTAADTEVRLLTQLRQQVPGLPGDLDLPSAIRWLRENAARLQRRKLLLVFDQFEQWLQARTEFGGEQLSEAVRQCNGLDVQALILVRDDFWMALTRWLSSIDVPLVQGHNVASVDLFNRQHAEHVLTAFGRAYGRLSQADELTPDERTFVKRMVDGIAREGKVVCVQLAMLAEMLKDTPWVGRTVHELGGSEGIGERFLDETFGSQTAQPRYRQHAKAAKSVLQTLLPTHGADIKGNMKSIGELQAASGYAAGSERFQELLNILDTDLRLITPTDPDVDAAGRATPDTPRYFQLTHDYLVPSLRSWLNREQQSTRRGRAELLLKNITELWNDRPESRRLPSLAEWTSIRRWTQSSRWNRTQQRMMRAANRRVARNFSLTVVLTVLLLLGGRYLNGRYQSSALIDRLKNADTRDLPPIIAELKEWQSWTAPLIQQELAELDSATPPTNSDERERLARQTRNLQLAAAGFNPAEVASVLDQLPEYRIETLGIVAEVLAPTVPVHGDQLWSRLDEALQQDDDLPLRVAAILSQIAAVDERWSDQSASLAQVILSKGRSESAVWRQLLRPAATHLAPALVSRYRQSDELSAAQLELLLEWISDYAADSAPLLVDAIEHAAPDHLPPLFEQLKNHPRQGLEFIQERLARFSHSDPPPTLALPEPVQQAVEQADGLIAAQSVMVTRLARSDFDAFDQPLRTAGLVPTCVRPYYIDSQQFIAAVWQQQTARCEVRWDLRLDQMPEADEEMRRAGLKPVDFARYARSDSAEFGWVMVWLLDDAPDLETRFVADATPTEYEAHEWEWTRKGFSLSRFDVWESADGRPHYMGIWDETHESTTESFGDWRYARAFGDLAPGMVQSDMRTVSLSPTHRDRLGIDKHLSLLEHSASLTPASDARDQKLLTIGALYSSLGDYSVARKLMGPVYYRWKDTNPLVHRHLANTYARAGITANLPLARDNYSRFLSADGAFITYLDLQVALWNNEYGQATAHLDVLEELSDGDEDTLRLLCRAYAAMSAQSPDAFAAREFLRCSVDVLRELLLHRSIKSPETLVYSVDFDSIRSSPVFAQLVLESALHQRTITAYRQKTNHETRQLWNISPDSHRLHSKQLLALGYSPDTVCTHAELSTNTLRSSSIWRRHLRPVRTSIATASARSNLILAAFSLDHSAPLEAALAAESSTDEWHYLTLTAPRVISARQVLVLLERTLTAESQFAALLILGASDCAAFPPDQFQRCLAFARVALTHDDEGVASAAHWCIRRLDETRRMSVSTLLVSRMLPITHPSLVQVGSSTNEPQRGEHEHRSWVQIPRLYAMGMTEVTRAEFIRFLADPRIRKHYGPRITRFGRLLATDQRPMTGVTWYDAAKYCQWLSEQDQTLSEADYCYPGIWDTTSEAMTLPSNYLRRTGYRLPTEAEWEWAARGNLAETIRFMGHDEQLLPGYAWCSVNASSATHPVATLRPNRNGLFDILGNVDEWCDDEHHAYAVPSDSFFRHDAAGNSTFPAANSWRAIRGGSYRSAPSDVRSARRNWNHPDYRSTSVGFRVARTVNPAVP